MAKQTLDRLTLGRQLNRIADLSAADSLNRDCAPDSLRRIGITGPPGAGKSTLIGKLIEHRVSADNRLAVVVIDPSSPVTRGAILGDRFRMEQAEHPQLYIRSFASRAAQDGLTDNLPDLLAVLGDHEFDEVLIETVGVGQIGGAVNLLVDTTVVVLNPHTGDHLQAMKAGIMEAADIFVVNKADLPGARQMAQDIQSILQISRQRDWPIPVLLVSAEEPASVAGLHAAIEAHGEWLDVHRDWPAMRRQRIRYTLKNILARRGAELIDGMDDATLELPLPESYQKIIAGL